MQKDHPRRLPMLPELGEVLVELGGFKEARTVVAEALETARAAGDRKVEAAARLTRMVVSMHGGESGSWSDGR